MNIHQCQFHCTIVSDFHAILTCMTAVISKVASSMNFKVPDTLTEKGALVSLFSINGMYCQDKKWLVSYFLINFIKYQLNMMIFLWYVWKSNLLVSNRTRCSCDREILLWTRKLNQIFAHFFCYDMETTNSHCW